MDTTPPRRIAMIGAGIAGLACARVLREAGADVVLFDKGRRPGGRAATRRADGFAFDHGAQYFTMDRRTAAATVAAAVRDEALERWDGNIMALSGDTAAPLDDDRRRWDRRRWVGVPGMSGLPRSLAAGLDVRRGHAIAAVTRDGTGWTLRARGDSPAVEADWVLVAVPAPQAVALLAASPGLADRAATAIMTPCWAVMLGFETPLTLPFDAAFVDGGALAWIARERSKPGRAGGDAWVLHATPSWSRDHLEADGDEVVTALCRAFRTVIDTKTLNPAFAAAHRWRYAGVEKPLGEACLLDRDLAIGACGDWCLGGNIEAAIASGRALADRIIAGSGPMPVGEYSQDRR